MYCDITLPDGRPFEGNCRGYLQSVVKRASAMGLACNVGCECEFYLFETDDRGDPTRIPLDHGGYFDIPPLDRGENIRREICFAIEEMGLHPEHKPPRERPRPERGLLPVHGALRSADNLNTFKSTVKAIAARKRAVRQLHAQAAGRPAGQRAAREYLAAAGRQKTCLKANWPPGARARTLWRASWPTPRELTAFCNPVPNSYARLGANEAPLYVSWSRQNRSQLVRLPSARGELCRVELRGPRPRGQPLPGHRADPGRRAGRHPAGTAAARGRQPQPVPAQCGRRAGMPAPHPAGSHHGGGPERIYQPGTAHRPAEQVLPVPDAALPRV